MHSFSSINAVMKRNTLDSMLMISKGTEICLREIPQVRNSNDEYKGCLIYRNMPVSTRCDVFSNLYRVVCLLSLPGLPLLFKRTAPAITVYHDIKRKIQENICLTVKGSINQYR
jgi:hypothetical protein